MKLTKLESIQSSGNCVQNRILIVAFLELRFFIHSLICKSLFAFIPNLEVQLEVRRVSSITRDRIEHQPGCPVKFRLCISGETKIKLTGVETNSEYIQFYGRT